MAKNGRSEMEGAWTLMIRGGQNGPERPTWELPFRHPLLPTPLSTGPSTVNPGPVPYTASQKELLNQIEMLARTRSNWNSRALLVGRKTK